MKTILLSICIPSYNRGHRALQNVESLLPSLENHPEIEIIVSDNGSTQNTEGYKQIQKMQTDRLRFHQFQENQFFWGNVNQVLKMSRGQFALLVSDEDLVLTENLPYYLKLLTYSHDAGFIRTQTSFYYDYFTDKYFEQGFESIQTFYANNNYMSGILYNRDILTNEVIDSLCSKFSNLTAYQYYPHLVFDHYIMVNSGVKSTCLPLIYEGEDEPAFIENIDQTNQLLKFDTFPSRLEQQRDFVQIIRDIPARETEKAFMFLRLYTKTGFLLRTNKSQYLATGISQYDILYQYLIQCYNDIETLNLNVLNQNRDILLADIWNCVKEFESQ